jgi:hypothetical protein
MITKTPSHIFDQVVLWGFHIFGVNVWISKTAIPPGGQMACTIDVRERYASVSFCQGANAPAILLAQYFSEKYVRDFDNVMQFLTPTEIVQWNTLRNEIAANGDPHPNTHAFAQVQKLIADRTMQHAPQDRDVA